MDTLTRAGLAEAVWREMGLPRREAERFVEGAIGEMTAALAAGEKVTISNFGSFVTRAKGPRPGRNPKTGEPAGGRVPSLEEPEGRRQREGVGEHTGRIAAPSPVSG